ncbi:MAG: RNA 2',3'-cyclic phosphodiesterase [Melioribacteraceae bacterium]|nr:RNA 2',3'-cyclic phosphodiesterase [Melioribacteraceae bacterium]
MKNRLFVALDIPNDILDQIIIIRDSIYTDTHPKWELKHKLHITLKFLGDVERNLLDEIIYALSSSIKLKKKLPLEFEKFGLFYRGQNPSILWCGLKKSETLYEIVKNIDSEFHKLGFRKDIFRFKPHLTLLRIRGNENISMIKKFIDYRMNGLTFIAERISLYKSELKPSGSVYTRLKSFEI